jgi:hypothetical protein
MKALNRRQQDRFWSKVDKSGPNPSDGARIGNCWIWMGAKDRKGYGRVGVDGVNTPAHRVSLAISGCDLDQSYIVCHVCENHACVRPQHLLASASRAGRPHKWRKGERIKRGAKKSKEEVFATRFWGNVNVADYSACWEWKLADSGKGYGSVTVGGRAGRAYGAHRVAFCVANGFVIQRLPSSLMVCHACDNRRCCNPEHLFLGEAVDNTHDMIRKGRQAIQAGERASRAKLTWAEVADIRRRRADGETWASLGRSFGVSAQTARVAGIGKTWVAA